MNNHLEKFTKTEELTVFVGTWNAAGKALNEEVSLFDWLFPVQLKAYKKTADIYVIGLQEIVELNANYLLISSNQHRVDSWKKNIKETIESIDK